MKKNFSVFYILLAGILWGTMGIWVRFYNNAGFDSMELVTIRAFVSLFIFGIYLLFKDINYLESS